MMLAIFVTWIVAMLVLGTLGALGFEWAGYAMVAVLVAVLVAGILYALVGAWLLAFGLVA